MNDRPTPPFPDQHMEPPGLEAEMDPQPRYRASDYRGSGKLEGRTAVITGGDSGIGRSVAVLFAREGANVALIYLPEEQRDAEDTREAVGQEGPEALLLAGDVSDPEFCRDAVRRTVDHFGALDVLVNNAAYQNHLGSIDDLDPDQWSRTFHTNVFGNFYMVKAALPHMQKGACIVNTGSVTGLEGSAGLLDYSATKGAIHAFTKALAKHLVDRGIRVNCVAPGPVWTPLNPAERETGATREFGKGVPFSRPAQPEEIAPAFVYFASSASSSYVTGEVLALLGGDTRAG